MDTNQKIGNVAKEAAINAAATLLLPSSQFWVDTKMFVSDVATDSTLTKDEKHAKVKRDLQFIFKDIAESIIDVAIKIAVWWLATQTNSNKP
jgi:hypothetical protein